MKNLKLAITLVGFLALTACNNDMPKTDTDDSSKASANTVGMPGGTYNPGSGGVVNPGGGAVNPTPIAPNRIRTLFDQYLPGCWTQEKQVAWQNFFSNGGTERDFIFTLQNVRNQNPSCLVGVAPSGVNDPHNIQAYFDYYLPGCYTQEKHAAWQTFFNNGGTDLDFQITLQQVAATRPACMR